VHEDIRDANTLVTRYQWNTTEGARNVVLFDFDRACRDGKVHYPANLIIKSITRHEGGKRVRGPSNRIVTGTWSKSSPDDCNSIFHSCSIIYTVTIFIVLYTKSYLSRSLVSSG
jgi:hypothetical protein